MSGTGSMVVGHYTLPMGASLRRSGRGGKLSDRSGLGDGILSKTACNTRRVTGNIATEWTEGSGLKSVRESNQQVQWNV